MIDIQVIAHSFISAILFYAMPISIGALVWNTSKFMTHKNTHSNEFLTLYNLFLYFALGQLLIFANALLVKYFYPYNFYSTFNLINYIFFLTSIVVNLALKAKNRVRKNEQLKHEKTTLKTFFIIFMVSVSVYTLWKWHSPLQTTLNWDLYHQQLLANVIKEGKFSYNTAELSDTFQFPSYPTIFHTLMAATQIKEISIPAYWWFAEFNHLILTGVALYLVAYGVFRNKSIAVVSAFMGAFLFESNGAYTNLFLIPQNITATFGAAFISKIFHDYKYGGSALHKENIVYIIFLLINHYIIGVISTGILLGVILLLTLERRIDLKKTANIGPVAVLIIGILLYRYTGELNLGYINRGEAGEYTPSIIEKFTMIRDFYGFFPASFGLLGLAYLIKRKGFEYKIFLMVTVGTIILFLLPVPYTPKFLAITRYFLIPTMATGFVVLTKTLRKPTRCLTHWLLFIAMILMFTSNIEKYKQSPKYRDVYTHVSEDELDAANFLKNNYTNKGAMIISEPATMHVLETLSGINSPGGAYTSIGTRKTLSDIYFKRDPLTIKEKLKDVRDSLPTEITNSRIFIFSKRFETWQKLGEGDKYGINKNIWAPLDLTLSDKEKGSFLNYLLTKTSLQVVYHNNNVYVFEL